MSSQTCQKNTKIHDFSSCFLTFILCQYKNYWEKNLTLTYKNQKDLCVPLFCIILICTKFYFQLYFHPMHLRYCCHSTCYRGRTRDTWMMDANLWTGQSPIDLHRGQESAKIIHVLSPGLSVQVPALYRSVVLNPHNTQGELMIYVPSVWYRFKKKCHSTPQKKNEPWFWYCFTQTVTFHLWGRVGFSSQPAQWTELSALKGFSLSTHSSLSPECSSVRPGDTSWDPSYTLLL